MQYNTNEILVEQNERLARARKDGIISSAIFAGDIIIPFLYGFFLGVPSEDTQNILGMIIAVTGLIGVYYIWRALKTIQEMCDNGVAKLFIRSIIVGILAIIILAIGSTMGDKNTGLIFVALGILMILYIAIIWFVINFRLAKSTKNKFFKIYTITSIVFAILVALMQVGAYFITVSILNGSMQISPEFKTALSVLLSIVTPLAVIAMQIATSLLQLIAWIKVEKIVCSEI
ncbi:hypothetical protein [Campylobacter sp.]|uniref:hypothetical protein n=1 Tax=Campylobacter sp. TaxID=205 RepID=UPI00270334B4|nr:hypothetical protein [Campylobacter sp.]